MCVIATAAAAKSPKFEDKWEKFCGVPDCYTELGLFPNATKVRLSVISSHFRPSSCVDGVVAMPHRLDALDAAVRESTRLAREPRPCRDAVVPHRHRSDELTGASV